MQTDPHITIEAAGDCRVPGLSKDFSGALDKAAPRGAALPEMLRTLYRVDHALYVLTDVFHCVGAGLLDNLDNC